MLAVWTPPVLAQVKVVELSGEVRDAAGRPVMGIRVQAGDVESTTSATGHYDLSIPAGPAQLKVISAGQLRFQVHLDVLESRELDIDLTVSSATTVTAESDAEEPDPSAQGFSRAELIDANPGRPGVPVSLPGFPSETASGGIKAPQYFAPGVAGDHGEPIAQFFAVNGYLFQNNLTANAHGNGYADPNFIIPASIDGALVDSAAYNARYGDHSVNLAATYELAERMQSFVSGATDGRDGDLAAGWGSRDGKREWVAGEALWGNGFLKRPEERQQYKINAFRAWDIGTHDVSLLAVGYYGFSRIPGLIPIDTPVPGDTVDPRQADLTHTTLLLGTDQWTIDANSSLVSGAYFRTYSLALRSNFGDGLIRQSEFRTVQGGGSEYDRHFARRWEALAGVEERRDAPRGLDLAHLNATGTGFQLVTGNDLTLTGLSPYAAISGRPTRWLQLYAGLRRDEVDFDNIDLLTPGNSFKAWSGLTSPKLSLTLGRLDTAVLPQLSFSFGKAFHANDPRIGSGTSRGDLLVPAREWQMVAAKVVRNTEVRLVLSRIANSEELAKIDPDTGLQEDQGPSLNRYLTVSAQRRFSHGSFRASWSQADARDRQDGTPVPEAPRTIVDGLGTYDHLPFGLTMKAEFEYVKAKPLGDGFTGLPLQEIRLALSRSFQDGKWIASLNGQLNSGYSGQTLETLQLQGEPTAFERIVGVPDRSYASFSLHYRFQQ